MAKKVEQNEMVSILYKVVDKDSSEVLDESNDKAFSFILGRDQVVIGLENALLNKEIGSKLNFEVSPEDAYGARNDDFIQEVPKEQFAGIELNKGMTLFGQSENGEVAQVIVSEIGENSVIIDYNHPMAGKTLCFEVEIIDSKIPSEDEILELESLLNSHSCEKGENCCGGANHTESGCGCK